MNTFLPTRTIIFGLSAAVAILLRLIVSRWGYNFDSESWQIVATAINDGQNIYTATTRYNYGFAWAYILAALQRVQWAMNLPEGVVGLHLCVVFFLSWVDVGIAYLLKKKIGLMAALVFLFNPISILLTGYHSQFDNLAILVGWWAWLEINKEKAKIPIIGILAFSLSLIIKHILIFFPIWWFFLRDWSLSRRWLLPIVIFAIFGFSFIPFATNTEAQQAIIKNVFTYQSFEGIAIIPKALQFIVGTSFIEQLPFSPYKIIFLAPLLAVGYFWVTRLRSHLFEGYLIALVACSAAMANQYLAIPLLSVAVFRRLPASWLYVVVGTCFLVLRPVRNIGDVDFIAHLFSWGNYEWLKAIFFSVYTCQIALWILIATIFWPKRSL